MIPNLNIHILQAAMLLGCACLPSVSAGEILGVREAEQTTITCAARMMPHQLLWASGKAIAPAQWGHTAGDQLEFDISLDTDQPELKLGVRYAFFQEWFLRDVKNPGPRELTLTVDGGSALPVAVPDTDGWNHFKVAEITLPPLQAGLHRFALTAPADNCDTNVDAFIFFKEPVNRVEHGLLRPTRLVDKEKGIVLCASVEAQLLEPPENTHENLQSLFNLMSQDFGKPLDAPLYFHLTDKARWWNTKARLVQNRYGIYVLADGRPYDRAEWCWALANYFVQGSGVPAWFSNSSSRVTGWMDWLPSLQGGAQDVEMQNAAIAQQMAVEFLASDNSVCDKAETVQLAMRIKYGGDIFRRFWNRVAEKQAESIAASRPLLTFNKFETLAILSEVAGEDVLPFFRRWRGFADEGPVDPLVLTMQLED